MQEIGPGFSLFHFESLLSKVYRRDTSMIQGIQDTGIQGYFHLLDESLGGHVDLGTSSQVMAFESQRSSNIQAMQKR